MCNLSLACLLGSNATFLQVKEYGTPFVAKLFSAMGDSYFKTNSVFYRIDSVFFCTTKSVFSLSQLGFFSELTQLLYRTDSVFFGTNSIILQNQLGSFTESTQLFYRTDSIILQNRHDCFTEPTRVFLVSFFSLLNKVRAHSRLKFPVKGHVVLNMPDY